MVQEVLQRLWRTKEFIDWRKNHEDYFLVHIFFMVESDTMGDVDIGYYDKGADRMEIFTLAPDDKVGMREETEIFRHPNVQLEVLDDHIEGMSIDEITEQVETFRKKNYPAEVPLKRIMLLQKIAKRELWNVTYVTGSFKTLNIRADPVSGKVIEDRLVPVFSMG